MAKRIRYKIGDVFLIPLEKNLKGIGRVLKKDEATIFIEVYRIKPIKDVSEYNFEKSVKEKPLFRSWCYDYALKNGEWEIIDNRPIEGHIEMPYFWIFDVGYMKYYIGKGSDNSYETCGELIEIPKEDICKYESCGIADEIFIMKRYIIRLREVGLM